MLTLFQQRRLTSLIVSLTMLLNLCAPAISHAMSALSADALALDLCSVSQIAATAPTAASAAPAASGKRAPAGQPAHGVKHCMLCPVHSGNDAPPSAASGLLTVLENLAIYPAPRSAAAPPPAIYSKAQPRGPPAA